MEKLPDQYLLFLTSPSLEKSTDKLGIKFNLGDLIKATEESGFNPVAYYDSKRVSDALPPRTVVVVAPKNKGEVEGSMQQRVFRLASLGPTPDGNGSVITEGGSCTAIIHFSGVDNRFEVRVFPSNEKAHDYVSRLKSLDDAGVSKISNNGILLLVES